MAELTKAMVDEIAKKLVDEGKLIAAGFIGMRLALVPKDASPAQVEDMELAFLGGAQHVWSTVMNILGPEAEPTEGDLRRMSQIDVELQQAAERLRLRTYGRGH